MPRLGRTAALPSASSEQGICLPGFKLGVQFHMLEGRTLVIDIVVDNVERAVQFYRNAFCATLRECSRTPDGVVDLVLYDGGEDSVVLRILDRAPPGESIEQQERRKRRMGTLLFEFRVNGVDTWIKRAVIEGAAVQVRLHAGADRVLRKVADDETCTYAHIIDPFGYRWALTQSVLASRE